MREKIIELNKKLEPFYLLILMIGFFIGGFITLYKILFSPPDLSVRVEKEDINYPSSINDKYIVIYNYIQDSINNTDLRNKSVELLNYLIKTKQQRNFDIQNNTNKTIKSVNIRLVNVRNLTSWAVSSSYLLEEEKSKLLNNILFENSSGIVYFKNALDLPPNGNLKIYLWGDFNNFVWVESLSVDYDGGNAKIESIKSFSGIKAVMAENYLGIFFFLVITFIIVYTLQINKYAISKKNISKPD